MEYLKLINIRAKSRSLLDLKKMKGMDLPKVVNINHDGGREAIVNFIDENGKKVSMGFYENDIVNRAEAYDEPWTMDWVSGNIALSSTEVELLQETRNKNATHKYYSIDVDYYGHPDTHMEMAEMNTGDFNIHYFEMAP